MRIENKIRIGLPSIFREIAQISDYYVSLCKKMKYIRKYICVSYMKHRHVLHESGGISNNEEQSFQFVKTC